MKKNNSLTRIPSKSLSEIKIKINTALGNKNIVQISKRQEIQFLNKKQSKRAMSMKSLTQKCMTQKLSNQNIKKVPYTYTNSKNIVLTNNLINMKNIRTSQISRMTNRPSASKSVKQEILKNQEFQQKKSQQNFAKKQLKKQPNSSYQSLINQENVIWIDTKQTSIEYIQKIVSKIKPTNQKQEQNKQHISYFAYNNNQKVIASFQKNLMNVEHENTLIFLAKNKLKNKQSQFKIQEFPCNKKTSIDLTQYKYVMITSQAIKYFQNPQKILNEFIQLKYDGIQSYQIINKILKRTVKEKIESKMYNKKASQQQQQQKNNFFILIFEVFPIYYSMLNQNCKKNEYFQKKISTVELIQKKLASFNKEQQISSKVRKKLFSNAVK